MLVATAVLAVVAIGAAVIAVRSVRQLSRTTPPVAAAPPASPRSSGVVVHEPRTVEAIEPELDPRSHSDLAPRLVEGRLVVPPTQQQVVQTALGRPGVRLSVFVHGAAHALRAESRDRISALMRREYRRRRRERLQAGRRAVRSAQPTPPADEWLSS